MNDLDLETIIEEFYPVEYVQLKIGQGADVDATTPDGSTLLERAITIHNVPAAQALVAGGARLDLGYPLHRAVTWPVARPTPAAEYLYLAGWLLRRGADPARRDPGGRTSRRSRPRGSGRTSRAWPCASLECGGPGREFSCFLGGAPSNSSCGYNNGIIL